MIRQLNINKYIIMHIIFNISLKKSIEIYPKIIKHWMLNIIWAYLHFMIGQRAVMSKTLFFMVLIIIR